jgi:hypothetical protein
VAYFYLSVVAYFYLSVVALPAFLLYKMKYSESNDNVTNTSVSCHYTLFVQSVTTVDICIVLCKCLESLALLVLGRRTGVLLTSMWHSWTCQRLSSPEFYLVGSKTSVLPTSIWHSQMCQ